MTKLKEPLVDQEEVNSQTKHDFVFQFIDHETGYRSEPFISNWTELGNILDSRTIEEPKPVDDDYILLVAVMDGKQSHIPSAPLVTVKTYLEKIRPVEALQ